MMLSDLEQLKLSDAVFYRLYDDITVVRNTDSAHLYIFNSSVKYLLDEFEDYISISHALKNLTDKYEFSNDSLTEIESYLKTFIEMLLDDGILIKKQVLIDDNNGLASQVFRKVLRDEQLHHVLFELTYRCQEKCLYCYCSPKSPEKTELSTEEVKKVLDDLADMEVFNVTFTGGDPFLRPDFFDILQYAAKKRLVTSIFTNGLAITDSDLIALKQLHLRDISFTLYSHIPEKHDRFTQHKGSFEKTLSCIRKCLALNIRALIKAPALNYNLTDLPFLIALAEELGASIQIGTSVSPRNNGDLAPTQYRLNSIEDHIRVNKIIENAFIASSSKDVIDAYFERDEYICNAGIGALSINPYGDVFACTSLLITCGNLRSESIKTIWNSSEQLKTIRGYKLSDLKGCEDCALKPKCHFCPGVALLETGDPLCKYSDACLLTKSSLEH